LSGRDGINGKDGRDGIDGKDGAIGPQGESGMPGRDGIDGINGKDGNAGIDGKDGMPGEPGPQGERGLDGKDGKFAALTLWKRGVHYESQLVTHKGSTYCARCDTAEEPPHEDWSLVAARGQDAPIGEIRGLFDAETTYNKLDLVAFNGCEWRAVKDNPGPLPGPGWALSAKQGKRGDKGERGERGEQGKEGRQGLPAPTLVKRRIDEFTLIDTLSDGSTVTCDLRPAFELYHGEAG
jgi:hypothetical protein